MFHSVQEEGGVVLFVIFCVCCTYFELFVLRMSMFPLVTPDYIITDPTKKGIHISNSLHFLHTVASIHGSPLLLSCLQVSSSDTQVLLVLLCFRIVATFQTNQHQTGLLVPIYSSYDATSHWAIASIGNPPIHLRLLIVADSPHN